MKKILALVLAFVLVIGATVAGTLAYLKDEETVVNTFTVGNIDIKLEETTTDYKIVPGVDIPKDPKVTVLGGSEDCYLFVQVTEENWNSKLTYSADTEEGWQALTGVPNVYYQVVTSGPDDQAFDFLTEDKVKVDATMTKAEVDAIRTSGNYPKLTFTAYAIQQAGFADANAAWTEVSKPATT